MFTISKFLKSFQKNQIIPKNEKEDKTTYNIEEKIEKNKLKKDTYNNFISDSYKYKSVV
jgi:hypothetical protein